jgi:hypothetical protein
LSTSRQIEEKRPWDARLVAWMARGSDKPQPEQHSRAEGAAFGVIHALVMGVASVSLGGILGGYIWPLAAVVFTVLCMRLFRWARQKLARTEGQLEVTQPNPFGQ